MADPFEVLREPVTPVDPDPDFARRLRQRLTLSVVFDLPGGTMSQQSVATPVEREQRGLRLLDGEPARADDPWETLIDRIRAREVLDRLGAHHRAALTLRYLDGLPVPDVARHLDRTVHATEALLVRARAAFRRIYEGEEGSR